MEPLEEPKTKIRKKALCRVCLNFDCKKSNGGLSVFDKYNNVYIHQKIHYIARIDIKKDDNLPDRICSTCLLALENACNFKQQCENSDAILHSQKLQLGEALSHHYLKAPIKEELDDKHEYDYLSEELSVPETEYNELFDTRDLIKNEENLHILKRRTADQIFECHDCGTSFKSKCKLRVHWKKVHLPQQLKCPICKSVHKTYRSLHNHIKKKTKACQTASKIRVEGEGKSRVFYCKHCDLKSNRIHTLMNHLVTHTGERPHVCDICNSSFTQISSLNGHKEVAHSINVKEATCQHCGKNIKGRNNWYRHMRYHTRVQQPCSVCGKMFASKASLRVHMKRHSGVKSLTCEMCAKTFYTSSDLCNHKVIRHYKNKVYSCEQCNYRTLNCSLMTRHRRRHTENNVACDHCGTFLDNEQQLIMHKKRHFEKNFKCSMCDKKFYGRKNLSAHIRKVHKMYAFEVGKKDVKVEMKAETTSI